MIYMKVTYVKGDRQAFTIVSLPGLPREIMSITSGGYTIIDTTLIGA